MWKALLIAASFACSASANFVKHTRDAPLIQETEWKLIGRAPTDHLINFQIALPVNQKAIASLERRATDSGTPGHENYRNHVTVDELKYALEPSSDSVDVVAQWLESSGIASHRQGDWIDASAVSVAQAQTLLDTIFYLYEDPHSGERIVRAESYSLPAHVVRHVDTIAPTTFIPPLPRRSQSQKLRKRSLVAPKMNALATTPKNASLPACGNGTVVTLDCVRQVYGFDKYVPSGQLSPAIGVPSYKLNDSDFQSFLDLYNPAAGKAKARPTEIKINPPYAGEQSFEDLETMLDISFSLGLVWPLSEYHYRFNQSSYFTAADNASQDLELSFLRQLATNKTVPPVISVSYGRYEYAYPEAYAKKVCQLLMQITSRGVSVLYSTTDSGAEGARSGSPYTFNVGFPAACPWVTSVGSTAFPLHEISATVSNISYSSGGGFSVYFPRPSWQDQTVVPYLKNHVDPRFANVSGFNASGRGTPDVAALGWAAPLFYSGHIEYNAGQGTSMATPIFASVIALLNDAEAKAGRKPLGFLNPWLYGAGKAGLRDITEGGPNSAYGQQPYPELTLGYNTTVGWDAVTGLGVPDFPKMLKTLQKSYT